jgi:MurNAc alpha-1-phosphate uridylyltransferase
VIKQAFVLAAGEGRRLRPLTLETPKPLIPIRQTHCLERILVKLKTHGVERIIINTHHLAEQVHKFVAGDPAIRVSFEQVLLESGGGIRHVLPYFGCDPFFVINGDIWWEDGEAPLLEALEARFENHMDALIAITPKENMPTYSGPGDYDISCEGKLAYRGDATTAAFVAGGIKIIRPSAYKGYLDGEIFSNKKVWDTLESQRKLYGFIHQDFLCDIGSHQALEFMTSYA